MYELPTAGDLGTYLGVGIDEDRAELLLQQAQRLCLSVINPLPDGAEAVIFSVCARAYANPTNAVSETEGIFSTSYDKVAGGLWLTRSETRALRRLGGGGGAFTIDTIPSTAGQGLPWWDATSSTGWPQGQQL